MKYFFCFLFLFFINHSSFSFEIQSEIKEASLVYGKLNRNERLYYRDNTEIKATPNGSFFFAIPQDQKKIKFILFKDNKKEVLTFNVKSCLWKEEFVNGLQESKVKPNLKNQKRISFENSLLQKARKSFSSSYFPTCFIRPVKEFKRISSPFGARRVLNNIKKAGHSGVDYAAPTGTPVFAPADGIVEFVHEDMFLSGKTILINHGYSLFSSYSHLNEILVKVGDQVSQGDMIAKIGSTGRSTGPHLHYAVMWNNLRVDPEHLVLDFACDK